MAPGLVPAWLVSCILACRGKLRRVEDLLIALIQAHTLDEGETYESDCTSSPDPRPFR